MVKVFNPFYGTYKNLKSGRLDFVEPIDVIEAKKQRDESQTEGMNLVAQDNATRNDIKKFNNNFEDVVKADKGQVVGGNNYSKGSLFRVTNAGKNKKKV